MNRVVGIDGCPSGWVCCEMEVGAPQRASARVCATFAEVLEAFADASVLGVDIPIGLPDAGERGGREVDRVARSMLGPARASSVFSAPVRAVLGATSYAHARELSVASSASGISLSVQAFNIVAKIREVDELISVAAQGRVVEVHPELCFAQMNGGDGLEPSKQTPEGRELRAQLLAAQGFTTVATVIRSVPRGQAAIDDVLDSMAACWTAGRVATGVAKRLPEGEPPIDSRGLRMEMWC
ncbi:MAG: DUF429 domain-containing protein [Phycisphaerales bacterium]|nr:DUF429 domain-containing protein [Phycisphaerales bacterium]